MAKMMVSGTYTEMGVKQMIQQGGSARVAAVTKLVEAMGGKLECMYFAFGSDDFVVITDGPLNFSVAAASSMVTASLGIARPRITWLMTADEVDAAAEMARGAVSAMQQAPQQG